MLFLLNSAEEKKSREKGEKTKNNERVLCLLKLYQWSTIALLQRLSSSLSFSLKHAPACVRTCINTNLGACALSFFLPLDRAHSDWQADQ